MLHEKGDGGNALDMIIMNRHILGKKSKDIAELRNVRKDMKKLFGCILSLVVAVMLVFTPAEHVYAQGLGLSVSSSSIAVGKTVKVTVSMPSGYFGTVVISSSDESTE